MSESKIGVVSGENAKELEREVLEYARFKLAEMGLDSEVAVLDAEVYGSRSAEGMYWSGSDIDVALSYTGNIREDDFFNAMHEDGCSFYGVDVDINPICSKSEKGERFKPFLDKAHDFLMNEALLIDSERANSMLETFEEAKKSGVEADLPRRKFLYKDSISVVDDEDPKFSYNGELWVAIDNSTDDFIVEDFGTEEGARCWLRNDELEASDIWKHEECGFSEGQMHEICKGLDFGLSDDQIEMFATPELHPREMVEIRLGFQNGLSKEQVATYASPLTVYSYLSCQEHEGYLLSGQMFEIRKGLERGLSVKQAKELANPNSCCRQIAEERDKMIKKNRIRDIERRTER